MKKFFVTTAFALVLAATQAHAQGMAATSPSDASSTPSGSMTSPGAGSQVQGTVDSTTGAAADVPTNMDAQQFDSYVTTQWDANGDGVIDNTEWDSATPQWFDPEQMEIRAFSDWDTNSDGLLDSTELDDTLSNTGLYGQYDTNGDGVIDAGEAARIPG